MTSSERIYLGHMFENENDYFSDNASSEIRTLYVHYGIDFLIASHKLFNKADPFRFIVEFQLAWVLDFSLWPKNWDIQNFFEIGPQ